MSAALESGGVVIRPADRPGDMAAIRQLLRDYLAETGLDLGFQGFDDELAGLPGDYAPPRGCLLCAQSGERIVGCVAFRPLDEGRCEMKRLYVLPGFRRSSLGAALVAAILDRARQAGYASMCLDTAPGMERAQALYERFGFQVGLFHTGALCGRVPFEQAEGRGFLHFLRRHFQAHLQVGFQTTTNYITDVGILVFSLHAYSNSAKALRTLASRP